MEIALRSGGRLRPFRPGDEDDLVRGADDREVWRNLRDGFPYPYTRGDAERWIAATVGFPPHTVFAIEMDAEVIGSIGLFPGQDVHRFVAEIGYWVARRRWGHGIATEAVQALTEHGLARRGYVRIHAGVFAWNPASARELEKAGYVREGLLRKWAYKDGTVVDAWLFARVRED